MKTIYCLIGFAGRYEFEALTDREFCDRHGIATSYEEWVANGGNLEEVMDFDNKSDALNYICDSIKCGALEQAEGDALCAEIINA